jgi:hypothetical protein
MKKNLSFGSELLSSLILMFGRSESFCLSSCFYRRFFLVCFAAKRAEASPFLLLISLAQATVSQFSVQFLWVVPSSKLVFSSSFSQQEFARYRFPRGGILWAAHSALTGFLCVKAGADRSWFFRSLS